MVEQSHLRPVEDGPDQSKRQPQRQRPGKSLPTDRLKFDLQVRILQTLGRLSGPGKRAVEADDLSRAIGGVATTTVGLSNGFFRDSGWIDRQGRGRYVATDALVEYSRRLAADPAQPQRAIERLRDPVRQSWYWQTLQPALAAGPVPLAEAIVMLAKEADAGMGHVPMLENVVEWLRWVGLVTVSDDQLRLAEATAEPAEAASRPEPAPDSPAATPAASEGKKPTTGQGGSLPGAVLAFSFDLQVTADDLSRLDPEQIRALFEAVGKVLAIKNARP
jgi:hypothetical protein